MSGHTEEVHCICLRGDLLVSGSADHTVRLWDWPSGTCLSVMAGHEGKVWSVSVDRMRVASGGRHGEVRVWDMRRQASLMTHETGQPTISLDIHPR